MNYFILGVLSIVFVSMFYTEKHFTSPGFDERKQLFSCLVTYLDSHGLSDDEFLQVPDDSHQSSSFECSKTISKEKNSIWHELNARLNFCGPRNNSESKSNEIHASNNDLKDCRSCMKRKLENTEYEITKLHGVAMNNTIIGFKIWQYFTMSPEVKNLTDSSHTLESESLAKCARKGECVRKIKICY